MAETLKGEGYNVTMATSARGASEALRQRTPDLLILDLKLPDGNGPALVTQLQRTEPPVPFVVVTGQGDDSAWIGDAANVALDIVSRSRPEAPPAPCVAD